MSKRTQELYPGGGRRLSPHELRELAELCEVDNTLDWLHFCRCILSSQLATLTHAEITDLFASRYGPPSGTTHQQTWYDRSTEPPFEITIAHDPERDDVQVRVAATTEYDTTTDVAVTEFSACAEEGVVTFTPELLEHLYQLTGEKKTRVDWAAFCAVLGVDTKKFSHFTDHMLAFQGKITAGLDREPDYHGRYRPQVKYVKRGENWKRVFPLQQLNLRCMQWFVPSIGSGYVLTVVWPRRASAGELAALEVQKVKVGEKRYRNLAETYATEPSTSNERQALLRSLFSILGKGWTEVDSLEARNETTELRPYEQFLTAAEYLTSGLGYPSVPKAFRGLTAGIADSKRMYEWQVEIDGTCYQVLLHNIVATQKAELLVRKMKKLPTKS